MRGRSGHRDRALQAFERTRDQRPVSPGTREGDVEIFVLMFRYFFPFLSLKREPLSPTEYPYLHFWLRLTMAAYAVDVTSTQAAVMKSGKASP